MELRAAHGAALLITSYEGLCKEAERVSAITDDSAGPAVLAFLKTNMKTFVAVQNKVERTWEPTGSADVNKAVQDVYDTITQKRQVYIKVLRLAHEKAAKGEIDKAKEVQTHLAATGALGKSRDDVNKLLPSLLTAVGVDT